MTYLRPNIHGNWKRTRERAMKLCMGTIGIVRAQGVLLPAYAVRGETIRRDGRP
jgi:hypothetical protein